MHAVRALCLFQMRFWAHHKSKLALLVLGMAAGCAFLAVIFPVGQFLFDDEPPWVDETHRYATILAEHENLGFRGVSLDLLQQLEAGGLVEDVDFVAYRTATLEFEGRRVTDARLVFLSPGLSATINRSAPGANKPLQGNRVILSESAASQLGVDVGANDGSHFGIESLPFELVAGAPLPDRLSASLPGRGEVWLSSELLRYFTPFASSPKSAGASDIVEAFLQASPAYLGIAKLGESDSPADAFGAIEAFLSENRELPSNDLLQFNAAGYRPVLLEGVNVDPAQRRRLEAQWLALLAVTIVLFMVTSLNGYGLFAGEMVEAWPDIQAMRVMGAAERFFLYAHALSVVPIVVAVSALAPVLLHLLLACLRLSGVMVWALDSRGFSPYSDLSSAMAISAAIVLCLRLLPLLALVRQQPFSRATTKTPSRLRDVLSKTSFSLQLTCLVLFLSLILSIGLLQYAQHSQNPVDTEAMEIVVEQSGNFSVPAELRGAGIPGLSNVDWAAAVGAFVGQVRTVGVSTSGVRSDIPAMTRFVTPTYFNVLDVEVSRLDAEEENGAVVSRSLYKRLRSLSGVPRDAPLIIDTGRFAAGEVAVTGVVDDLPHLGRGRRDFFLYLPLDSEVLADEFTIYLPGNSGSVPTDAVVRWSETQGLSVAGQRIRSLSRLLWEYEAESRVLFTALVGFSALLIFIVITSAFFQTKMRMVLKAPELALYRALGATGIRVDAHALKEFMVAFLVSLVASIYLYWVCSGYFADLTALDLLSWKSFALAYLVTSLAITLAVVYYVRRLMKGSLMDNIKSM